MRTFTFGAIHRVTYKGSRVRAVYHAPGVWYVGGVPVPTEDVLDVSPEVEPPKVHDVQWSVE